MIYKTIDLCAGIGGIRRGFELTKKFENVLSAEVDKHACLTYEHLFGENPRNDVTSDEFQEKVKNTTYDVLLSGFPCQPFSRAGKQDGFADTKGTLFFHIAKIIETTRPKGFLLENVDNLLNIDKGDTFRRILEILVIDLDYHIFGAYKDDDGSIKYDRKEFVRNSRFFGIPQNRPRVYIVGIQNEMYSQIGDEKPSQLPLGREKKIYASINELIELDAEPKYFMSSGYLETLEKHKLREKSKGNGFGYKVINLPGIDNPIANTIMATGGSGKERNLIYDPIPSVSGLLLPNKRTPINDKQIRVMTPREWGKLQGFVNYAFLDSENTDHFSFPENMPESQKYKQLGNSVTIPVIEDIAEFIYNVLFISQIKTARNGICSFLSENQSITSGMARCVTGLDKQIVTRALNELLLEGTIEIKGKKRGCKYSLSKTNDFNVD